MPNKILINNIINVLPRNQANQARWLQRREYADIRKIAVHWNGTPTVEDEMRQLRGDANYHILKNWGKKSPAYGWAIMYHYGVGQSGTIYKLNDERDILWHATDANDIALGIICLIGEGQHPTPALLSSLRSLLDFLTYDMSDLSAGRKDVGGHGEFGGIYGGMGDYGNSTDCPGPDILKFVRAYRAEEPQAGVTLNGHRIGGYIFREWAVSGGIAINGLPITDQREEEISGLKLQVQWFERARLELHPDGSVTRGLVGVEALGAKNK